MTPRQQRRAEVLARLHASTLSTTEAATLLGRSERQVRRLRHRYAADGLVAALHGNQGRAPANRTEAAVRTRLHALVGEGGPYHDLTVCHLQERLAEDEHLLLGRSTLDRLLKQEGLRPVRRRGAGPKRRRRERAAAAGLLLQIDASPHAWLEDRGPRLTLVGAIDDATGAVVYLHFQPTEDQAGYIRLLRTVAQTHGLPHSVYHDRHTILRSPKQPTLEDELAGRLPQSQVQRLLAELGILSIPAHSPQAKGRIERLWGTLQDRLRKELRLAGISTAEAANAFLPAFIPRFNARFAQPAADPHPAWQPLPTGIDLAYTFAARETRTVRADHCVAWQGQLWQLDLDAQTPSLARGTVTVHVLPEGAVFVYAGTRRLRYHVVTRPQERPVPGTGIAVTQSTHPSRPATARQRAWLFGHHTATAHGQNR